METIIDQQYKSGNSLVNFLVENKELSLSNEAETNFRKTFLLSIASFFEKEISDTMIEFAKTHTNNNQLVVSIIKRKAISRQYHTYFEWDTVKASGANSFFALFGNDFKEEMRTLVRSNSDLENAIIAFLEIGRERNKMVHQNFAEATIEKTAKEIYELYEKALYFVENVKEKLIKEQIENQPATSILA